MFRLLTLFAGLSISLGTVAQNGTIRGQVFDASTGETLIGVTVIIKGTTTGSFTDLDGKFSFKAPAGVHEIQCSYVSFLTQTVTGVEVKPDEVTVMGSITMQTASQELQEVVVKAEVIKNNETALIAMKRNSVSMIDGISAQKMALTGDGNAAEAAKRVTGISIEGGKYIYVRGLGDRYSKTTLNGLEIPGLDPDRNSLQLDIFPSNLINNLTVSKNFMAELPGDFAGGLMNIETKDFPERKSLKVSGGLSFNPDMHFNSDYLTYESSATDFLGLDDGMRALPRGADNATLPIPFGGATDESINRFVNGFDPTLAAQRESSLLDYSLSVDYGNQIDLGSEDDNRKLGVIASLSYSSDYRYYDELIYGEYQRASDSSDKELIQANLQTGEMGEQSVLLGAIAGLAYKTDLSKVRLTVMRLQSGTTRAAKFRIENDDQAVGQSGYLAFSDNLEYNERSLTNLFLGGRHVLKDSKWDLDWGISPTLSVSEDPDIRKTAFSAFTNSLGEVTYDFNAGQAGLPSRIWRSLDETNIASRADLTYSYKYKGRASKLKFGLANIYKVRNYEILQFDLAIPNAVNVWEGPNPDFVLQPDNIYSADNPFGIFVRSGNETPNPNEYNSDVMNSGIYVSNQMNLSRRLNTVVGLRVERYYQRHTGRDIAFATGDLEGNNLVDAEVLNTINLMPSVNLIYALTNEQNLRLAYSRTVARPSFKELSFAQIIDPISNRIFNGGLFPYVDGEGNVSWDGNLTETKVDNMDLRWEAFQDRGQMFSISGFYKRFQDPIELVRIPEQQTSAEFQPRNVGDGEVYGVEIEARKELGFISERLSRLSLNFNLTLAESSISMTELEFESRKRFEREGESIDDRREMQGQSPYVINGGMTYQNQDGSTRAGLFYNVKGPTLEVVGVGLYSDVYTQPFHSLNFSLSRQLGEGNTSVDLKVGNILDDRLESFYESFEADSQIFTALNPGRSFSLGFSHRF